MNVPHSASRGYLRGRSNKIVRHSTLILSTGGRTQVSVEGEMQEHTSVTIYLHKCNYLQFVLQINMPYRACMRGWCVKPNPKGYVLQCTPFYRAYIKG